MNPPDTLTETLTDKTVRAVSGQGTHVHSKLCTVISSTAWIMRHLGVLTLLSFVKVSLDSHIEKGGGERGGRGVRF